MLKNLILGPRRHLLMKWKKRDGGPAGTRSLADRQLAFCASLFNHTEPITIRYNLYSRGNRSSLFPYVPLAFLLIPAFHGDAGVGPILLLESITIIYFPQRLLAAPSHPLASGPQVAPPTLVLAHTRSLLPFAGTAVGTAQWEFGRVVFLRRYPSLITSHPFFFFFFILMF